MNSRETFRLVLYRTDEDNKYDADDRHEFFGDVDAIWYLWFVFTELQKERHVEIFTLAGTRCEPERGRSYLQGYNI